MIRADSPPIAEGQLPVIWGTEIWNRLSGEPVAVRLGKLDLSKAKREVMAGPNVAAETREAAAVERDLRKVEEGIASVNNNVEVASR